MRPARARLVAWASAAGLALAVLYPLTRPRGWDDYPISSYPMFSRGDIGRVVPLGHAVIVGQGRGDGSGGAGAGAEGEARRPVPLALIGTPEPMVAKSIVEKAIARGAASDLCKTLAARVGAEEASRGSQAPLAVEIVTSTFDTRAYFAEGRAPVRREVHARCEVPR